MLVASSCGTTGFDRGDAIARFETGGASSDEATCMADVLIQLNQLNAIDPSLQPGEEAIAAMVSAAQLCKSVEPVALANVAVEDDR